MKLGQAIYEKQQQAELRPVPRVLRKRPPTRMWSTPNSPKSTTTRLMPNALSPPRPPTGGRGRGPGHEHRNRFYELLEVERTADDATLKSAYRKLAIKYHPDKNGGCKDSEAKFKASTRPMTASRIRRSARPMTASAMPPSSNGMGGGGGGFGAQDFGAFSDIFESVFGEFMGGRGGQPAARRGADLRYDMEITLEDAFHGKEDEITIDVSAKCDTCDGTRRRARHQRRNLPDLRRATARCARSRASSWSSGPARLPRRRRASSSPVPRLPRRGPDRQDQDARGQRPARRGRRHAHPPVRARARRARAARRRAISTSSSTSPSHAIFEREGTTLLRARRSASRRRRWAARSTCRGSTAKAS
jgi:hypothetical protein